MTREEAIRIFRKEIECMSHTFCTDCPFEKVCDPISTTPLDSEYIKAYDMAIEALSAEPCEDATLKDIFCMGCEYKEQEPCEDAISRQTVLDELGKWDWQELYLPIHFKQILDNLPSVTPKQKMGRWLEKDGWDGDVYYECSICGEPFCLIDGTPADNMYNYCPNCGAKMVEPQESEDKE